MLNLGTIMARMQLNIDGFTDSLRQAEDNIRATETRFSGFSDIGKRFEKTGKALTTSLTLPLIGAGVAVGKLYTDLETSMAKVGSIADTTNVSLKTLEQGVVDLSNKTGNSTSDLAEAMYQAISAGVDTAKSVQFLDTAVKAAKGGFTDTTTAVDGLTTILNAYGLESTEAEKIANQMLITQNKGKTTFGELAQSMGNVVPIASALGIGTDELFSSMATLTMNGIQTSQAVTGLKASFSNIIKPTKESQEAAKALGIEFNANAVETKGWSGFLVDMRTQIANVNPKLVAQADAVAKLQAQVKEGNQATEKYNSLIAKEREEITRLNELKKKSLDRDEKNMLDAQIASREANIKSIQKQSEANTSAGASQKDLNKALKEAQDEMDLLIEMSGGSTSSMAKLFGSVEGLNSMLVLTSEQGMASMEDTMKEMGTNTEALEKAFNQMDDTTGNRLAKSFNKLKNAGAQFGESVAPIIEKVAVVIGKLADKIAGLSPRQQDMIVKFGLVVASVGPVLLIFGKLMGSVTSIATGIRTMKEISEKLKFLEAIKGAKTFAVSVGQGVVDVAKMTASLIQQGAAQVATAAKTVASTGALVINKGIQLASTAVTTGLTMATTALGAAFTFLTGPIGLIILAIAAVIAIGVLLWKNWDKVSEYATMLWGKLKDIFGNIGNFIGGVWSNVSEFGSRTWGNIKEGTLNIIGNMREGLVNRFNNMRDKASEVWGNIKGSVESHGGGIKGILGTYVETYKGIWSAGFNFLNNVTGGKLGEIWDGVRSIASKVKNALSDMFDFKLPKIKLPHFSLSGEFSLMPPKVPKVGVNWYAKGGIFERPSVIGVGEAGQEAVIPIAKLSGILAETLKTLNLGQDTKGGDGLVLKIDKFINNDSKDIEQLARELESYRRRLAMAKGGR